MADIILSADANWSTCKAGGAPAAGDTIWLGDTAAVGYILTLDGGNDAVYTCVAIRATQGTDQTTLNNGTIAPGASTPYTLACEIYAGTTTLLINASGKTITSVLKVTGGSGGSNRHGISNAGNITLVGAAIGGSATTCYGVLQTGGTIGTITLAQGGAVGPGFGTSGGTISLITSAVGGSGAGAYGVRNAGSAATITTITSATGGTADGAHGLYRDNGYVTNPIGIAKGGSTPLAFGVVNDCPVTVRPAIAITALDTTGVAAPVGVPNLSLPAGAWIGVGLTVPLLKVCIESSGIVDAANVVVGNDNYTGGAAGTYPTTATSKAAQLADDIIEVDASKQFIQEGKTILTVLGTLVSTGVSLLFRKILR